jgi:hypothetical protein
MTATTEDYKKYFCALGARGVRRLTAKIHAADVGCDLRQSMLEEAHRLVQWQRCAVLVGWPSDDDECTDQACDDHECDDDCEAVTVVDFWTYSDGSPVLSTVVWDEGFATIVYHPDGFSQPDTGELEVEMWPCGHRPHLRDPDRGDDEDDPDENEVPPEDRHGWGRRWKWQ